jgi:hypothetical protein
MSAGRHVKCHFKSDHASPKSVTINVFRNRLVLLRFAASVFHGVLFLQEFQIAEQIFRNALRFGFRIKRVQLLRDLLDSMFPIAELNDFEARAADAHAPIRKQKLTRQLIFIVQANSLREAGDGGHFRFHQAPQ